MKRSPLSLAPIRRSRLSAVLLCALLSACASNPPPQALQRLAWCGADVSFLPQLEALGVAFKEAGSVKPLLSIMKDNGVNWVRLRLWVDPAAHGGWCDLDQTVALAARVKAAGFSLLLDFHYSDWWADPGNQAIPAAWASLDAEQLAAQVGSYTRASLQAFIDAGAAPDMVQVGNEISGGMLWPLGKVNWAWGYSSAPVLKGSWDGWAEGIPMVLVGQETWQALVPAGDVEFKLVAGSTWYGDENDDGVLDATGGAAANLSLAAGSSSRVFTVDASDGSWSLGSDALPDPWESLMSFLDAGLDASRELLPDAILMLHLDAGSDNAACRNWFDRAREAGLDWDAIGLSYYPVWQGTDLSRLQANLNDLALRYGKDVCVVETSYPWTLLWNDGEPNVVGMESQLVPGYPATTAGQKAYLSRIVDIVAAVPGGRGKGVFWWEPDFVAAPGFPSSMENLTWFDFDLNFNGTSSAFLDE